MSRVERELEASRLLLAGLQLLQKALPAGTGAAEATASLIQSAEADIASLEPPPWVAEPSTDPTSVPWGRVVAGDHVRGGDDRYYPVTGVRREGPKVSVSIDVNGRINTYPRQAETDVMCKRGPDGRAADLFADAGFRLDILSSGEEQS